MQAQDIDHFLSDDMCTGQWGASSAAALQKPVSFLIRLI